MSAAQTQRVENLPVLAPPRLQFHPAIEERFGIDRASWKALVEAIFPNAATTESVVLALSYCRARKLDPFKRTIHIVPIWNRQLKQMVDTIWPGIGELRTTAFRTGEYAGRDEARFGPTIVLGKVGKIDMNYPEWCAVTVYRLIKGNRVAFYGPKVYWIETYATAGRDDDSPNEMWRNRPIGQLEKCAEAAALRAAFPEEIGGDLIEDEVSNQMIVAQTGPSRPSEPPPLVKRGSPVAPEQESPQEDSAPPTAEPKTESADAGKSEQAITSPFVQSLKEMDDAKRADTAEVIPETPPWMATTQAEFVANCVKASGMGEDDSSDIAKGVELFWKLNTAKNKPGPSEVNRLDIYDACRFLCINAQGQINRAKLAESRKGLSSEK